MEYDAYPPSKPAKVVPNAEVQSLATRAVLLLSTGGTDKPGMIDSQLDALCDAYLAHDDGPRHDLIDRMRANGLSASDIIDYVVPATARILGQRWFDDEISFVHVTIGAARLQETVRALAMRKRNFNSEVTRPNILLVLPRPEHHTIGAFVAAEQFRRMGYRVEVAVDLHPRQIADLVRRRRFAMVGITASGRRTLAYTKELVDKIRSTVTRVTPVVVGGAALENANLDVLALTGADHLAHDAQTALELCGLTVAETGPPRNVTADHVD